VGTCATDFGWLVSAFHGIPNGPCDEASMRTGLKANLYQLAGWSYLPDTVRGTADYHKLYQSGQHLSGDSAPSARTVRAEQQNVDKVLIN
jgi:hypothetical protein